MLSPFVWKVGLYLLRFKCHLGDQIVHKVGISELPVHTQVVLLVVKLYGLYRVGQLECFFFLCLFLDRINVKLRENALH